MDEFQLLGIAYVSFASLCGRIHCGLENCTSLYSEFIDYDLEMEGNNTKNRILNLYKTYNFTNEIKFFIDKLKKAYYYKIVNEVGITKTFFCFEKTLA